MHNPNRHNNRALQNRRPQPPPGAGISHSSIMRKHSGPSSIPAGDRKDKPTGFHVILFEGESFAARYEVVRPRCTSGQIINKQDDRTVFVAAGTLFVTKHSDQGPETTKLLKGAYVNLPRDTRYELSTSGTEGAELYISEGLLYEHHLEQITEPTVGEANVADEMMTQSISPLPTRHAQNPVDVQNRVDLARAINERRAQQQNGGGVAPQINANSANVQGVSPRPMGARASFEE